MHNAQAIITLALLILILGCSEQPELHRSMKGWELRSWEEDGRWQYSLLPGTNRMKLCDEIVADPLQDLNELKKELGKLSKGEEVFWSDAGSTPSDCRDFRFPQGEAVLEIKGYADESGLRMTIFDQQGS